MWSRKQHLNIIVTPDALAMCLKSARGIVIHSAEIIHQTDFKSSNLSGMSEGLEKLAAQFPAEMRRADTYVSVALPDPLFQQSKLEFDEFPKSTKEAHELVAWRHTRELNLINDEVSVGYQKLDKGKSGTVSILTQSLSVKVTEAVCATLWHAGLVPSRIDALSSFLTPGSSKTSADQSGLYFWRGPHWWCFRIIGIDNQIDPIFASWQSLEEGEDYILRRLKRICAVAKPTPSYIQAFYRAEKAIFTTIDTLSSERKMDLTTTNLTSWKAMAERLEVR